LRSGDTACYRIHMRRLRICAGERLCLHALNESTQSAPRDWRRGELCSEKRILLRRHAPGDTSRARRAQAYYTLHFIVDSASIHQVSVTQSHRRRGMSALRVVACLCASGPSALVSFIRLIRQNCVDRPRPRTILAFDVSRVWRKNLLPVRPVAYTSIVSHQTKKFFDRPYDSVQQINSSRLI